jgi:syntaxin-binding protein 5
VTALAVHPTGHLLATGYADGSIAFWAIEDDHKPILVRTVDHEDVDIVDGSQLEESLRLGQEERTKPHANLPLEPIFKLSWSGFLDDSGSLRGETALTILGGLTADHASGVTIHWFPSNTVIQSTTSATALQGRSWRESLVPFHTSFLPTKRITRDYLIVPRNTPHFAGSFDPVAILLLGEGDGKTRSTEAYQFPRIVSNKSSTMEPSNSATPASTVSVQIRDDFPRLELPGALRNGDNGIIAGQLINLGRGAHSQLVHESNVESHLSLRGGIAWTDDLAVNEKTYAKVSSAYTACATMIISFQSQYQPPRVSVTTHIDLTVGFEDISADLLINPDRSPMRYPFPRPLPDLTIDVMSILSDPLVLPRISPTVPRQARIDSIHIARESLECGMVLQTGEVIICRMRSNSHQITASREIPDSELIPLEHITPLAGRRFYPFLMLAAGRTRLTTFAISDIGMTFYLIPMVSTFIFVYLQDSWRLPIVTGLSLWLT